MTITWVVNRRDALLAVGLLAAVAWVEDIDLIGQRKAAKGQAEVAEGQGKAVPHQQLVAGRLDPGRDIEVEAVIPACRDNQRRC